MPVRISLFLFGIIVLLLLVLGNPERVVIQFLFWRTSYELYQVIIGSAALGAVLALLFHSHFNYLKRLRKRFFGS
ncbi:MAG: DUF1049 domain-containing protein [Spirochaetales bacterium]|nr:DUF1049 domain-containing protein [Spirochaetales bacterium]